MEEIEEHFPALIPGLAQHPGIGFVMAKSLARGPVVIGPKGRYYLEGGLVEGENPLEGFGPLTARNLLRNAGFKHIPDLTVNSIYDTEKDEVAAFEELIGSHGGAGGDQTHAFLMYPSEWDLDGVDILGAEEVHRVLKAHMPAS